MASKGKIGIGILVLVVVVGGALAFSGKGQFFGGRFNDRDDRGGRGGGRGDDRGGPYGRGGGSGGDEGGPATQEIGPDLAVLTIEPSYVTYEAKPGTFANYYRHNVKFAHAGGAKLPAKYDWKVFLNNKEYTKLALNTLPSTWPYYAFDVLDSVACPSFNVFEPSIRVELDPANKVAETNENNNTVVSNPIAMSVQQQYGAGCYNKSINVGFGSWGGLLNRCHMAIMLDKNLPSFLVQPPVPPTPKKIIFSDIKDPACKEAAEDLAAKGMINLYGVKQPDDGTYLFGGDMQVNRAEAAKLLGYMMKTDFLAVSGGFPDVPATEWYYKDVTTLLAAGKANGKADLVGFTDGLYRPTAIALTAWFQAMINMLK